MQLPRNPTRKSAFDLDKFYQNLQRIENSLGKSAPRSTTGSLPKNNNHGKNVDEDKVGSLATFKKQLHNKGLIKGKIKLDRPYDKSKMSYATEYEQVPSMSDHIAMSQQSRESNEDHFERVRNKLQGWRHEGSKSQNIDMSGMEYDSMKDEKMNFRRDNKQNFENTLEHARDYHLSVAHEHRKQAQSAKSQLISELSKRNKLYLIAQQGLKMTPSYYKKEIDVSLALEDNFRKQELMAKVIGEFKQICGLDIKDMGDLYKFLRGSPTGPTSLVDCESKVIDE